MRRAARARPRASGEAARAALEAHGLDGHRGGGRRRPALGNDEELALLDGTDVLVKSPGVPGEAAARAGCPRAHGIPVWSEIELGFRLLPENPIARGHRDEGQDDDERAARAHPRRARSRATSGRPLSALVGEGRAGRSSIVCEVSSFQLEDIDELRAARSRCSSTSSATTSTATALSRRIWAAKLRIFENQGPDDVAVVPRGFGRIDGAARRVEFDAGRRAAGGAADPRRAQPRERGRRGGRRGAGGRSRTRRRSPRACAPFPGVPHRLEPVRRDRRRPVRQRLDRDQHARGPTARCTTYDAPLHLILGGQPKGEPFDELAAAVAAADVVTAYLIGEASDELARALG